MVYVGICEKSIVVACYEEFVGMWLRFEPGKGVVKFVLSPGHSEVACVDEDVAVWKRGLVVVGV